MTAVRWGVLTTARIAQEKVIPALQSARNASVEAISSPRGRAAEVAAKFNIPRSYVSHEELLADPAIEAVYLPFPNGLHARWIVAAAEAGKHVLCEKPLVATLDDYDRVRAACRNNGVALMEAFMYRFHPQHHMTRELVTAGRIGRPISMHARFHFAMNRSPEEIRLDTALQGGALNDVGCYAVDVMNMMAGRPPLTVYARGISLSDPVDTSVAGILDYDGLLGTFDCGFDGPRTNTFQVIGSEGQISLDHAFDPDPDQIPRITISDRQGQTEVLEVVADQFRIEVEQFSAWVRGTAPTVLHEQLTEQNLAVRLALHESMATNQPMPVAVTVPQNR